MEKKASVNFVFLHTKKIIMKIIVFCILTFIIAGLGGRVRIKIGNYPGY